MTKQSTLRGARSLLFVVLTAGSAASALAAEEVKWWDPGQGGTLPAQANYDNPNGKVGYLNSNGPTDTKDHPFFTALGSNGRACVTCHQPADGMSVSLSTIRDRWQITNGKDPMFSAIDGSNCPNLPQADKASHSLLLNRGLFRIFAPWPPRKLDGTVIDPEFTIEVVRDPTGCNTSKEYGLKSATPAVSVYRRPRPVANMKYIATTGGMFNIKTGDLMDTDPETGAYVGMNLMSDSRQPTLKTQARSAMLDHLQVQDTHISADKINTIAKFEEGVYVAQASDKRGGNFVEAGGPDGLGPEGMLKNQRGLGDNVYTPVFGMYDAWRPEKTAALSPEQRDFRASVARGSDIYLKRTFWIRDVTHINTIGLGNPIKRTCATCHNSRMVGMDLAPGYVDLGTMNFPTWTEPQTFSDVSDLPVFKLTCKDSKQHRFLGRVVYTSDPGRALASGKCEDIGSITMQQLRGLSARAPYFANGSAKTLRELIDYYDRRFDAKYTEVEKQDLVNFLSVL